MPPADGGTRASEPAAPEPRVLCFSDFRLDCAAHSLTRNGVQVPLRPQAFELLAYLASNPGRLVSKDELLAHLWA
jgi:DNA-binding response OmpR family regulator